MIPGPALLAHAAVSPQGSLLLGDGAVFLACAAFIFLLVRGGTRTRVRPPVAPAIAAVVALGLALSSPLEALAERSFAAHMLQHVVLIVVVAPLLAAGDAITVAFRALPWKTRRSVVRAAARLGLRRVFARVEEPPVAWLVGALVLWVWHVPALFEAALAEPLLHAAEHVTLLGASLLFWRVAFGKRRIVAGGAALFVFSAGVQATFLAALITFSEVPWYRAYSKGVLPAAAAYDQHLAGLIMWIPVGAFYIGISLALVLRWMRDLERRIPPRLATGLDPAQAEDLAATEGGRRRVE